MTNQEQDIKIERTSQQVDDFKSIIENFIGEMRDRDNQRAAEIREFRERQNFLQQKHDEEMREIKRRIDAKFEKIDEKFEKIDAKFEKIDAKFNKFDEKMEKFGAQIQNMAVAVVVVVGAIVWAVISVVK